MFEITMPKAGQTMEDGTVVKWHKAEGDAVREGEILLEIETDKATIEVEAAHSGTLRRILCPEGATVPVHTVIALIGSAEEAVPAGVGGTSGQVAERQAAVPAEAPEPAAPAPQRAGEGAAAELPPPPPGIIPVLMPKAGQSVEEGELLAWRVKVGDRIQPGQIIFEVETDKAAIEVEATDAGRLSRIVLNEGETCEVLRPVAYLSEDDAAVDAYLASVRESPGVQGRVAGETQGPSPVAPEARAAKAQAGRAPSLTGEGRIKASPAARKIAGERGIDLSIIGAGRGPGGRILSTDVPLAAPAPSQRPAAAPVAPAGPAPAAAAPLRRRMSGMRRAIARNLLASKQNIPHFYVRLTIDADPMMAFYRAEKAKYPCSVNDVVALACARAIAEFPAFRSRLEGEEIVEFPSANVGIAVGMEDGLVVPVLLSADRMNLRRLAAESKRIAEAARKGKIEGLGQGIFTITNLGMFGVEEFAAIINPPEASILAVGAVREDVVVSGGAMRPGKVMTMTLSADHRVIDGLLAAKFLARLKEILLNPAQLG